MQPPRSFRDYVVEKCLGVIRGDTKRVYRCEFVYRGLNCTAARCLRNNDMWVGFVQLQKKPRADTNAKADFTFKCDKDWYMGIHFMHLCDYTDISGGRTKHLDDVATALFELVDFYLDCKK